MRRIVGRVRQAVCALRGHEMVLRREPGRLSLQCLACGAQTRGWIIDVKAFYRRRRPQRAERPEIDHDTSMPQGSRSRRHGLKPWASPAKAA
jgi:hypothetical protein